MSKVTYQVELPNGTLAFRTTESMAYTHATVTQDSVKRWHTSTEAASEFARGIAGAKVVEATVKPKAERKAKAAKPAAKRTRKAKADDAVAAELVTNPAVAKAVEAKPATGPRGELLARKAFAFEEGELAGYVVVLPFREFETAKVNKANADSVPAERRWVTRCVEHGTHTFAANGTDAERAGARKARQVWCKGCAKALAAK